ncbi:hypothetical protein WIV_gp120 [Wiseana iridescent virus]|uniref:Uncharacterized protein n=1 Tax=Wiseana iridescent virus TaxID=68347 RepID=G0T5E6_IRV9|nr:hypothetical protein WIV_gp120 [Wiseana iridescent virus]ADO00464.1 hypothetical protein [Wiseana iridescent virus]
MGNTTASESTIEPEDNCEHGFDTNTGSYNHLNNDSLESIHYKNDYNGEILEGHPVADVLHNMYFQNSLPNQIENACNNCNSQSDHGGTSDHSQSDHGGTSDHSQSDDFGSNRWQHRP